MPLAVVGACALQEFGEAGAVVALFGLSEFLEDHALRTATTAMGSVLALQPQFARRLSASDIEVPIEDVAVGETVLVRPGESVPLDGVVVGGKGEGELCIPEASWAKNILGWILDLSFWAELKHH